MRSDGPQPRRLHMLHVEDAHSDARLFAQAMREAGGDVEIQHVLSADEGLRWLAAGDRPDLILLDLHLPRMSGHEFLEQVRANESTTNLPVLILTTSRAETDIDRAYSHHANAYYVKPGDFLELVELAASIINHWSCRAWLPRGPDGSGGRPHYAA